MSSRSYIDNRWKLDREKHKDANDSDLERKQFAYRKWSDDRVEALIRRDRWISEMNDTRGQLYQLIGFYSVFQAVLFQGVTGLAAQRGCSFSIIPITLSVLVSVVTLVGFQVKFSEVFHLHIRQYEDLLSSKVRESYIAACEVEGVNFDFDTIEERAKVAIVFLKNIFLAELRTYHRLRVTVLAVLAIASALFAWLIYLIMCGKYD